MGGPSGSGKIGGTKSKSKLNESEFHQIPHPLAKAAGEINNDKLSYTEKMATKKYVHTGNSFSLNKELYSGNFEKLMQRTDIKEYIDLDRKIVEAHNKIDPLRDAYLNNKLSPAEENQYEGIKDTIKGMEDDQNFIMANSNLADSNFRKVSEIDRFSNVINKSEMPINGKLYRFTDTSEFSHIVSKIGASGAVMDAIKNISGWHPDSNSLKAAASAINKSLSGATYKNTSFISTSYDTGKNVFTGRPIEMTFYTPKGTKAFVTTNHQESEVVMNHGQNMKIIGAAYDELRGKLQVKVQVLN